MILLSLRFRYLHHKIFGFLIHKDFEISDIFKATCFEFYLHDVVVIHLLISKVVIFSIFKANSPTLKSVFKQVPFILVNFWDNNLNRALHLRVKVWTKTLIQVTCLINIRAYNNWIVGFRFC